MTPREPPGGVPRHIVRTAAFLLFLALGTAEASPWKRDEQVLLLPQPAHLLPDGTVSLSIQAWVYEFEPRRGSVRLFARYLGLDLDAMPADRRALFEARTQLFRVDSERGKDLHIRVGRDQVVSLPRTRPDGRAGLDTVVPAGVAGPDGRIALEVVMPAGDHRRFTTRAWLLPPTGLSVISDIDDTLRHSQVQDRRELLLNTFARPFAAIPGMAARFRALAAIPGTHFHYVSASPLQLYLALEAFLVEAGFPEGSLHLRETTSWRSLLSAGSGSRGHKRAAISRLLRDSPDRRFLLVGDSGEQDPEIYAEVARAHPGRIVGIAIRDLGGATVDAPRYRQLQAGLPAGLLSVFTDGRDWDPGPALDRGGPQG